AELSRRLPATPCTLAISAILKAILSDFAERGVNLPTSAQDLRLARVVMDQLECAQPHDDYLPYGRTPALREVLDALQAEPGDNRSLAQWAQQVHSTERTLARHCQRELGMTFGEWRQRLRFLAAIEALEAGRGIQQIAFDLGYSSPSAFISMFRRLAGTTPEQYRLASRAQDMPML
ncbi:helix-turn-helix domain-containing protein, partial [Pseudomonas aeruginosa]